MTARVLVAGIGNVLFGDDGFGPAVIERLTERPFSADVRLFDAGVRGFDLTLALLEGCESAILVDVLCRGRAPGTLYVLDPEPAEPTAGGGLDPGGDPHGLEPSRALTLARATGARLSFLRVVACEPSPELELTMELSPAVRAAVESAAQVVTDLVAQLLGEKKADA
jgi:hydrogenase maturation protease